MLDRGGDRTPRSTSSGSPPERLRSRSTADLPLVRADAAQLERAFANLLENAGPLLGRPPGLGPRRVTRRPAARPRRRPRPRDPAGAARPRLRAVLPRRDARAPATAARGSGSRSCAGSSRPTAGACRSSRSPARARASSSSSRPSLRARRAGAPTRPPRAREREAARPGLRRRAADPARAAGHPARRRLRGRPRVDRARRRSTTPRCSPPDAAIIDLVLPDGDGIEVSRAAARVDDDADHRALGRRRGGAEGPRAGGGRRRLRHQAVRPARARRAPAGRAAPRRRPRPTSRCCGPTGSSSTSPPTASAATARRSTSRRSSSSCSSVLDAQPRPAADPPRAAHRGVGPGLRRRHRDAAHPHRQPAAQDRARAAASARYIRTDAGVGYRFGV